LDRETCICPHNYSSEVPAFWLEAEDGKIDFAQAVCNEKTDRWELMARVLKKTLEQNLLAEERCSVNAIKIMKVKK